MIDSELDVSILNQCKLTGVPRATYYYQPKAEREESLRQMKMIDEQYLSTPFYGSRRMTEALKYKGELINRKKVQRLMRLMGLEAMYPKPRTTIGCKEHYKHPYLLKGLDICKPNQVWGTDITYVPTETGFVYLVAIMDLYSRYVVSWELSDSLESDFCVSVVEKALKKEGKPEILNSDQGCQYTSKIYTNLLKKNNVSISMSGRGRCWDNIFVERLWRSYKYEEVYVKGYATKKEVIAGACGYFKFYNEERLHEKLNYTTPLLVHKKKTLSL